MIDKGQKNRIDSVSTIGSGVLDLNLGKITEASTLTSSEMALYGLTDDVIERIFEGQYRCVRSVNGNVISIWSLNANTNGTWVSIYLQMGDGSYAWSRLAMRRSTKGGVWNIYLDEI